MNLMRPPSWICSLYLFYSFLGVTISGGHRAVVLYVSLYRDCNNCRMHGTILNHGRMHQCRDFGTFQLPGPAEMSLPSPSHPQLSQVGRVYCWLVSFRPCDWTNKSLFLPNDWHVTPTLHIHQLWSRFTQLKSVAVVWHSKLTIPGVALRCELHLGMSQIQEAPSCCKQCIWNSSLSRIEEKTLTDIQ
jgi:hypothetical protein